jgi:hypothetical protein
MTEISTEKLSPKKGEYYKNESGDILRINGVGRGVEWHTLDQHLILVTRMRDSQELEFRYPDSDGYFINCVVVQFVNYEDRKYRYIDYIDKDKINKLKPILSERYEFIKVKEE